jgi:hypothetical protein
MLIFKARKAASHVRMFSEQIIKKNVVIFSVSMQNATVNFVLGLSVGLVFAFLAVSYMSGKLSFKDN